MEEHNIEKTEKSIKVFEYGCLKPIVGEEAMINQMFLRNKFWNRLVEIENTYQKSYMEITQVPNNPLDDLYKELEAIRKEIRVARQKACCAKIDCSSLTQKAVDLKEQINQVKVEVQDINLIKLSEKPFAEEGVKNNKHAEYFRRIAAISGVK